MKNVLLLVHDDPGEEARLQAALDLTRALSGHLSCIDVVQLPYLIGTDYRLADAELVLLDDAPRREAANRQRTEARLEKEDVNWDWADTTGDIAKVIEAESVPADIIILNTAFADRAPPDMRAIVSDVVMRVRKPILAMPETARGLDTKGHVLVAWDGTAPVHETLHATIPLLALAQGVTLLEIGEIDDLPAEEAAAYLSRHDIHARIDRTTTQEWTVADALLAACRDRQPAYCLMGAYGHARLQERLFGGVTRRMLSESPVPIILGH